MRGSVSEKAAFGLHTSNILTISEKSKLYFFLFCLRGIGCSSDETKYHISRFPFFSQHKKQFDLPRVFLPIISIQEETSESDDDSLVQIAKKVNLCQTNGNVYIYVPELSFLHNFEGEIF